MQPCEGLSLRGLFGAALWPVQHSQTCHVQQAWPLSGQLRRAANPSIEGAKSATPAEISVRLCFAVLTPPT